MRLSIRQRVCVLALLGIGIVAAADAQTTPQSDDEITGSIGAPASARMLPLSDEERSHIYEGIMRMPNARVVDVDPIEPTESVPSTVPLQDLPGSVEREIPLVRGHKFVKLDDRILVVNPASRRVVVYIPRYKVMMQ